MDFSEKIAVLVVIGIVAVTAVDTLGAIASRKLNFKYTSLAIISFAIYLLIGFWGSKLIDPNTAIIVAILVGIYDATIGLWMTIKLKANINTTPERLKSIVGLQSIVVMIITALIFSSIGYALTKV